MKDKRREINEQFEHLRIKLMQLISDRNWNKALNLLSVIAEGYYIYNQAYRDNFLEKELMFLSGKLTAQIKSKVLVERENRDVLFYDGFESSGNDYRGLVYIYLKALCEAGYHIVYVIPKQKENGIPNIKALLQRYHGEIQCFSSGYSGAVFQELWTICCKYKVKYSFLYTTPWDVIGLAVFNGLKGQTQRYLINLTDHAFWLGINALDYCLEFREYGASISANYRGLQKSQLIMQPYYPIVDEHIKFKGFPFQVKKDDFVIFSGGSLYKTLGAGGTFYRIVDSCLQKYSNLKFWYAGSGDDTEMRKLIQKYPGRAVLTEERPDLLALLQHVDLYLNTYPISGGLMLQYAALAGRIPLTLVHDEDAKGLLLHQDTLGIYFCDENSFLKELYQLIENKKYRKRKESHLAGTVISADDFRDNLICILETGKSRFPIQVGKVDTDGMRQNCLENFDAEKTIPRLVATKRHYRLLFTLPTLFLRGGLPKIFLKLRKRF